MKQKANVDLIPMIDVVFQLILFFLVSTTFAMLPGITLDLPKSQTAEGTETTSITITVESSGKMWLNSTEVSFQQMDEMLSDPLLTGIELTAEEKLEYPIQLEADELVTNGTIVRVFDVLRKNGFSAVNLRTKDF
jgi:biopolymer transport protein ExbD